MFQLNNPSTQQESQTDDLKVRSNTVEGNIESSIPNSPTSQPTEIVRETRADIIASKDATTPTDTSTNAILLEHEATQEIAREYTDIIMRDLENIITNFTSVMRDENLPSEVKLRIFRMVYMKIKKGQKTINPSRTDLAQEIVKIFEAHIDRLPKNSQERIKAKVAITKIKVETELYDEKPDSGKINEYFTFFKGVLADKNSTKIDIATAYSAIARIYKVFHRNIEKALVSIEEAIQAINTMSETDPEAKRLLDKLISTKFNFERANALKNGVQIDTLKQKEFYSEKLETEKETPERSAILKQALGEIAFIEGDLKKARELLQAAIEFFLINQPVNKWAIEKIAKLLKKIPKPSEEDGSTFPFTPTQILTQMHYRNSSIHSNRPTRLSEVHLVGSILSIKIFKGEIKPIDLIDNKPSEIKAVAYCLEKAGLLELALECANLALRKYEEKREHGCIQETQEIINRLERIIREKETQETNDGHDQPHQINQPRKPRKELIQKQPKEICAEELSGFLRRIISKYRETAPGKLRITNQNGDQELETLDRILEKNANGFEDLANEIMSKIGDDRFKKMTTDRLRSMLSQGVIIVSFLKQILNLIEPKK